MASRFFQTLPRDQELAGCSLHAICKFLSGVAFSTQVQKSKLQGKWVDVLFMHALASACKVDIAIYWNQHTVAQHLVGTSLFSEDAEGIVPLVLAENFHWWAAVPMESDPVASVAVVNKLDLQSEVDDQVNAQDAEELDLPRHNLSLLPMQEQIQVCECLRQWQPWKLPTQDIVQALQILV